MAALIVSALHRGLGGRHGCGLRGQRLRGHRARFIERQLLRSLRLVRVLAAERRIELLSDHLRRVLVSRPEVAIAQVADVFAAVRVGRRDDDDVIGRGAELFHEGAVIAHLTGLAAQFVAYLDLRSEGGIERIAVEAADASRLRGVIGHHAGASSEELERRIGHGMELSVVHASRRGPVVRCFWWASYARPVANAFTSRERSLSSFLRKSFRLTGLIRSMSKRPCRWSTSWAAARAPSPSRAISNSLPAGFLPRRITKSGAVMASGIESKDRHASMPIADFPLWEISGLHTTP